ncbi:hypothetical protein [Bartonella tribocorum]|uniref:hypothetical protein n=1 Tax=Bartonella tribocorum TaxID=85701 RepID=UPI00043AD00E|nr:hypothetical protein [Bartonella tribocorum]CDO49499.1 hypothetical protein BM1374166_01853 [Bartonella tribocorum]
MSLCIEGKVGERGGVFTGEEERGNERWRERGKEFANERGQLCSVGGRVRSWGVEPCGWSSVGWKSGMLGSG